MFFLTHLLDKPDTEHTGQVRERSRADFEFWLSSLSVGELCLGNVSEQEMGLLSCG